MAVSSNSRTAPGRRAFLSGAAASALATAAPVALAAADPDAGLTELFQRWRTAADTHGRVMDFFQSLDEVRELPDPPEALFRRPGDLRCFYGFTGSVQHESGRRWYGDDRSLAYLRERSFTDWVPGKSDNDEDVPLVEVPAERANRRREEILAAWEQWQAEIARMDEQSGYAAALAAREAARDLAHDLRATVIETPATTLQGLRLKAEVALGSCFSTAEEWLEELDEGMASPEQIAATICVDLLAIVGAAA